MTTQHTSGPWIARGGETNAEVFSADTGDRIAKADLVIDETEPGKWKGNLENTQANARLIAAAPELLEALEIAQAWLNNLRIELREGGMADMSQIRAVIAKAKGRL